MSAASFCVAIQEHNVHKPQDLPKSSADQVQNFFTNSKEEHFGENIPDTSRQCTLFKMYALCFFLPLEKHIFPSKSSIKWFLI